MQVAESSVVMLPLHTCDIVAALSQCQLATRVVSVRPQKLNADLTAHGTVEICILAGGFGRSE